MERRPIRKAVCRSYSGEKICPEWNYSSHEPAQDVCQKVQARGGFVIGLYTNHVIEEQWLIRFIQDSLPMFVYEKLGQTHLKYWDGISPTEKSDLGEKIARRANKYVLTPVWCGETGVISAAGGLSFWVTKCPAHRALAVEQGYIYIYDSDPEKVGAEILKNILAHCIGVQ